MTAEAARGGLEWDALELLLTGGEQPDGDVSRAGWNPKLHPRGVHGKFAHTQGGGKAAAARLPWTPAAGGHVNYHGHMGIDRQDMPQLSGLNHQGEYHSSAEMQPKFRQFLAGKGVKTTERTARPEDLRPTQTQGDMKPIRAIADQIKAGKPTKPVVVSSDGRVLDGHHNWAAHVLANSEGHKGRMRVIQAHEPMAALTGHAHEFAASQGLRSRKTGEIANPKYAHNATGAAEVVDVAGKDDSQAKYKTGGKYTSERQILHDKIIGEMLAGHHAQTHPVATFFGGGPASGKSALKPGEDSVVIDADAIKAKLPEYNAMMKAGDSRAASYVHEESSDVAKAVQAAAIARRFNYTLDGTGDSAYEKMAGKLAAARAAGYKVDGQYVTVDTDEAVRRAMDRAKSTGRMVPPTVIRSVHQSVSEVLPRLIENHMFDSVKLWDNNGNGKPTLVGEQLPGQNWVLRDENAWARFLAKGGVIQ